MKIESTTYQNYIKWTATTAIFLCIAVFILNYAIDPLWHFGGNKINKINPPFNERESKTNQFIKSKIKYDCIIFGSSRTTLIHASELKPKKNCFNFSFSSGQVEEFIAFANYLKAIEAKPSFVIVGIDGFNFAETGRDAPSIPKFITELLPPKTAFQDYMSIDTLRMSITALRQNSNPRYYDDSLNCIVAANAPQFDPSHLDRAEGRARMYSPKRSQVEFSSERATLYASLVEIFPDAVYVAYVPPISAWHINKMNADQQLDGYLDALHATSKYFSRMFDFSIPSEITAETHNTYDGSHYSVEVNRDIAHVLTGTKVTNWGLEITSLTRSAYGAHYKTALEIFLRDEQRRAIKTTTKQ